MYSNQLALSAMRPLLPPPAEVGLIHAENVIPEAYTSARLPPPGTVTAAVVPPKVSAPFTRPDEVQVGEFTKVPVCEPPEESETDVPLPSSSFQLPTGPVWANRGAENTDANETSATHRDRLEANAS